MKYRTKDVGTQETLRRASLARNRPNLCSLAAPFYLLPPALSFAVPPFDGPCRGLHD